MDDFKSGRDWINNKPLTMEQVDRCLAVSLELCVGSEAGQRP